MSTGIRRKGFNLVQSQVAFQSLPVECGESVI